MVIVISVAVTCAIVIILNIIMFFRDSRFKRRFENNVGHKLKNLTDDNYYLNQDVNKLKSELDKTKSSIDSLHSLFMDMKVEVSKESLTVDKHFKDMGDKVDLALISIRNIQNNFLNREDEEGVWIWKIRSYFYLVRFYFHLA